MSDRLLAVPVPSQQRRSEPDSTDLPSALMSTAEADADALADRLHDGALQALVVARYATDAAVRGGDPALARDAVQEALVALRRTVWLLRPRGGDDLPSALAELSKRLVAAGAPGLALELDPGVADALTGTAATAAYRFVQATTADTGGSVHLGRDGTYAALTVTGGRLPDPTAWSVRATALGGRLDRAGDPARLLLPLTPLRSDPEGDR